MSSLVVYGLLAFFIMLSLRNSLARTAVLLLASALILMIGFTRIYLGVHYFSDVVGGYIIGAAWLSVCISAVNIFENRRQNRITISSDSKAAS